MARTKCRDDGQPFYLQVNASQLSIESFLSTRMISMSSFIHKINAVASVKRIMVRTNKRSSSHDGLAKSHHSVLELSGSVFIAWNGKSGGGAIEGSTARVLLSTIIGFDSSRRALVEVFCIFSLLRTEYYLNMYRGWPS